MMDRMAKRVKSKRLGIRRLADDFQKSRHELAMKLQAQLGTHCHVNAPSLLAKVAGCLLLSVAKTYDLVC